MGYHIFVASQITFNISINKGVYGGTHMSGSSKARQINSEVISSLMSIKLGDFVFFYVKKVGFYGLWKITKELFYDEYNIYGDPKQKYPYRVCFEPAVRKFDKPVALSDILDLRDKGKIWTFDLGAFIKKNHFPITSKEGKEIIRLLLRNNPVSIPPSSIPQAYSPARTNSPPLSFEYNKHGHLRYEGYLSAWFSRSFTQGKLKELIGDYHDFLNYVPTSFNKVMDIFLTHVTTIDSVDILHKFTCIELKTGIVSEADLNQVVKYENWLVRKLADGDSEMIQSILVGFDFDKRVIEYCKKRKAIDEKTVRLIKYRVNSARKDLNLDEINV